MMKLFLLLFVLLAFVAHGLQADGSVDTGIDNTGNSDDQAVEKTAEDTAKAGEGEEADNTVGDAANTGEEEADNTGGDTAKTGEGEATNTGDGDAAKTGEGDAAKTGEGDAAKTGEGDAAKTGEGDAAKTGEGDAAKTGGEADKTGGEADKATEKTDDDKKTPSLDVLLAKSSDDCKSHYNNCFGDTSTFADLKGKQLPALKKDACPLIKKAEECLTTEKDSKVCTSEEFEGVRKAICFSPRTVANVAIVLLVCALGKFLGHQ